MTNKQAKKNATQLIATKAVDEVLERANSVKLSKSQLFAIKAYREQQQVLINKLNALEYDYREVLAEIEQDNELEPGALGREFLINPDNGAVVPKPAEPPLVLDEPTEFPAGTKLDRPVVLGTNDTSAEE